MKGAFTAAWIALHDLAFVRAGRAVLLLGFALLDLAFWARGAALVDSMRTDPFCAFGGSETPIRGILRNMHILRSVRGDRILGNVVHTKRSGAGVGLDCIGVGSRAGVKSRCAVK